MIKKFRIILGFLLLGVAVFFGVKYFLDVYSPTDLETEQYGPGYVEIQVAEYPDLNEPIGEFVEAVTSDEEMTADFEALQALNPDIYAWLEIPGTDISYPIVQDPVDDSFYLRHNSDREYSAGGAIYSEATYNSTEFNDPVTILYGHHMNAGNLMFGRLEEYFTDTEFLNSDPIIRIYTPDEVLEYNVFAAVPFNNYHILYYNEMGDSSIFRSFFQTVLNTRELGAYTNEAYLPTDPESDRVLILSTCLTGNTSRRFLVMATLSDQ